MPNSWKRTALILLATALATGGICRGETVLPQLDVLTTPSAIGRSPMDIAYGIDYEPDPMQLARLQIDRPELIQYRGQIQIPGEELRVLDACDFRGNDFSKLYCLDTDNFGPDDVTRLVTIDSQTASVSYIAEFTLPGAEGNEGVNGLTYDPTSGRMYAGSCAPFFGSESYVYELDLEALTLTEVAASDEDVCLKALGTDNAGHLWGTDDVLDGLVSIDKAVGTIAFVGPFGFEVAFGGGMDFDPTDNACYVFVFNVESDRGELHRCDTETGHTQLVGALGEANHGAGHWGTGAIAAPSDCHVTLELGADEVHAGDPLTVQVGIVHNRAQTALVPLELAIVDGSGNVVTSRSATRTMKVADHLDRQLMLRVPKTLAPGSYMVTLDVGEMEQGDVHLTKMFTVVASSN